MSTVKASWSQLPVQGSNLASATNLAGDHFATSSTDGSQSYVQVWVPDSSPGDWNLVSQVSVPKPVTKLAWAHPESGLLLAGSTESGGVFVVEAPRPFQRPAAAAAGAAGADSMDTGDVREEDDEEREWQVSAELQAGTAPISQLTFAPRQYGLLLSAASDEGHVYVWEADRPVAPNSWCLQAKIQVSASRSGGCRALAWRGFNPGVAPLLAAGTASGVDVWQYVAQFMTWQRVATLSLSSPEPPSSVHWAPSLGRPVDMVAAAHGSTVDVFSLQGDSVAPEHELLASLQHDAPVWKVEFNRLGTCLGAATDSQRVYVYRPNFVGDWQCVSVVQGAADAAGSEGDDA